MSAAVGAEFVCGGEAEASHVDEESCPGGTGNMMASDSNCRLLLSPHIPLPQSSSGLPPHYLSECELLQADEDISHVLQCKPLSEAKVKALCDKLKVSGFIRHMLRHLKRPGIFSAVLVSAMNYHITASPFASF